MYLFYIYIIYLTPHAPLSSAYVNSNFYCANLELHNDVNAEQCTWKMECSEPVIKLVKKEKGEWKSLLKYKVGFSYPSVGHVYFVP